MIAIFIPIDTDVEFVTVPADEVAEWVAVFPGALAVPVA